MNSFRLVAGDALADPPGTGLSCASEALALDRGAQMCTTAPERLAGCARIEV